MTSDVSIISLLWTRETKKILPLVFFYYSFWLQCTAMLQHSYTLCTLCSKSPSTFSHRNRIFLMFLLSCDPKAHWTKTPLFTLSEGFKTASRKTKVGANVCLSARVANFPSERRGSRQPSIADSRCRRALAYYSGGMKSRLRVN